MAVAKCTDHKNNMKQPFKKYQKLIGTKIHFHIIKNHNRNQRGYGFIF